MYFLYREEIDLLLSPAAAGRPKPFIPGDIRRFEKMLINSRTITSQTLGVPVIMANRVGPLETDLPGKLPYLKSSFPGLSSIVDSDGTVKESMAGEEGVIVADINMDGKERKKKCQENLERCGVFLCPGMLLSGLLLREWVKSHMLLIRAGKTGLGQFIQRLKIVHPNRTPGMFFTTRTI